MDGLYTLHVLSELHFNCTLKTSLWGSIWSLYITLYSNEFTLSNLYTRLFILPYYTSRTNFTGGRGELLTSLLPDQLYRGEGAHVISPSRPAVQEERGELLTSLIPLPAVSWRLSSQTVWSAIDKYIWNLQIYIYANKRIYV